MPKRNPDGAAILDRVHASLVRYVIFPTPEAAVGVTLWIAATHAQPSWEHASRLVVKSPQRRCGKTRLLEVAVSLVHGPRPTSNISPAALVRSINETDPPTIVLDEADTVFATRRGERSEGAEDIRGILNAGHSRGFPYVRWDAQRRTTEEVPNFAMAILAGIGDLPDTIEDRAVIISLRRRAPGEEVAKFRQKVARPQLHQLREELHEWVESQADALAGSDPELPVEDRAADVWEPLVAIADAAGGPWPDRAREACLALVGTSTGDEDHTTELLADLRRLFGTARLRSTKELIDGLNEDESAPWGGYFHRQGVDSRWLADKLKPYKVTSKKVRPDSDPKRSLFGYSADDLADVWERYLPPEPPSGRLFDE